MMKSVNDESNMALFRLFICKQACVIYHNDDRMSNILYLENICAELQMMAVSFLREGGNVLTSPGTFHSWSVL